MVKKYKEDNLRKILIILYSSFIQSPRDRNNRSNLIKFDKDYGGLVVYNNILKSQPIPYYLEKAIGHVSTIMQYGLGTYKNDWVMETAKKSLKELMKVDKDNRNAKDFANNKR